MCPKINVFGKARNFQMEAKIKTIKVLQFDEKIRKKGLNLESILPNFDFFAFPIFVGKLECLKHDKILSVLQNGPA